MPEDFKVSDPSAPPGLFQGPRRKMEVDRRCGSLFNSIPTFESFYTLSLLVLLFMLTQYWFLPFSLQTRPELA